MSSLAFSVNLVGPEGEREREGGGERKMMIKSTGFVNFIISNKANVHEIRCVHAGLYVKEDNVLI